MVKLAHHSPEKAFYTRLLTAIKVREKNDETKISKIIVNYLNNIYI